MAFPMVSTQPITAVRAALKTILFIFLRFKVFSASRTRQVNLRLSPPIINPQKKRQQPCRPSSCQFSKNERVLRPLNFIPDKPHGNSGSPQPGPGQSPRYPLPGWSPWTDPTTRSDYQKTPDCRFGQPHRRPTGCIRPRR